MFDFFTLVFAVLLLLEAVGGALLVAWWMQRRGDNTLVWWSLAHGVGVLMLWLGWYVWGSSFSRLPYADLLLVGLLLLGIVPALFYLVMRLSRVEGLLYGSNGRRGLWQLFAQGELGQPDDLAVDLLAAMEAPEQQFYLEYQPIFHTRSREVSGFEALLRWRHPVHGLISPAQFIPVAEEHGIIVSLGRWVLETACITAYDWPEHWALSVNVSPVQLRSARFVVNVQEALTQSGLKPERLQVEVTEGVMIESASKVMSRLGEVRDIGVKVAIDDFGAGYSSLRYLERLPCDTVKIDRSFISDLEEDRAAQAITAAVIKLCHELGHEVVAEGVETQGQLSVLAEQGCQRVQGYLLGRPTPVTELLERYGPKEVVNKGAGAAAVPGLETLAPLLPASDEAAWAEPAADVPAAAKARARAT